MRHQFPLKFPGKTSPEDTRTLLIWMFEHLSLVTSFHWNMSHPSPRMLHCTPHSITFSMSASTACLKVSSAVEVIWDLLKYCSWIESKSSNCEPHYREWLLDLALPSAQETLRFEKTRNEKTIYIFPLSFIMYIMLVEPVKEYWKYFSCSNPMISMSMKTNMSQRANWSKVSK